MGLNEYQQVARLIKNLKNNQWQSSLIAGTENYVNWIPIDHLLEDKEIFTGISELGYWVIGYGNKIILLSDDKYLRDFLPCLKKSLSELSRQIDEELVKKKIPVEVKNTFPFQEIILMGLKSESEFWAELALNWLEYIKINEKIKEQLQQITQAKWASQKTRQKASKFLKGKIRQNSFSSS